MGNNKPLNVPKKVSEKRIGTTVGSKVVSSHIVNCKFEDKSVDALVTVFDDGYIEVGCCVDRDNCNCRYGYRPPVRNPRPWYKNWQWFVGLVGSPVQQIVSIALLVGMIWLFSKLGIPFPPTKGG